MRDFRFSCNVFGLGSRADFVQYCQDAERFGYSTLFTADHLGSPAPFSPLVLAAQVTERLRQADASGDIGLKVNLESQIVDETRHKEELERVLAGWDQR